MIVSAARIAIKAMPDGLAFQLTRGLAAMTRRTPPSPAEREAMAGAVRCHYGEGGRNVYWSWGAEGPLVVLVHGWGGRAAQMAPLASALAGRGFRCAAMDIRGHGESPLMHTSWTYLLDDVAAFQDALKEEAYAYVAHSAGALTTMAGRSLKGIAARRYVCISAPSHPFPPIDVIRKRLAPRDGVVERYRAHIAAQFASDWRRLEQGVAYAGAADDLLLCYDEGDRFVPHHEGDRIHALCPGSRLLKTRGYSHTRILAAPEVLAAAGDFLVAGHPVQAPAATPARRAACL